MFLASRWLATAALAATFALSALAAPAPAEAAEPKLRVIVDLGDVIFRNGHPYYRHGGYGYDDRLVIERDRWGRPVYYRYAPRDRYVPDPPYGNAWGYHRNRDLRERRICDSRGRCRVEYYDPRYDRRHGDRYDDDRYYRDRYNHDRYNRDRYYSRHDRRWDDRRRWKNEHDD